MNPTTLFLLAAAVVSARSMTVASDSTLPAPKNPTYRVELGLTTYCKQCHKNRETDWLDLAASWVVVPDARQYRFCFGSQPYIYDSHCHVYKPPSSRIKDGRVLFNPGYTIYIGSYCKMMKLCVLPYTSEPVVRAEDGSGKVSKFVNVVLTTSIAGAENACKLANETTQQVADEKTYIADVKFTTKRIPLVDGELQNGPKWVDVKVSYSLQRQWYIMGSFFFSLLLY
eukprot:comp24282_c1_seq3/m.45354 comp24282_c1_seq3/g.45354  ORF comp24282_c1_seq3/g.45354 comp24282_c1_seq3/m.45354 type:complete len:227 (-) comp24282_c1_seq3:20-700(-)